MKKAFKVIGKILYFIFSFLLIMVSIPVESHARKVNGRKKYQKYKKNKRNKSLLFN